MFLGNYNRYRFELTFNLPILGKHPIYRWGFRFICFEIYLTDLNGHIRLFNITLSWSKLWI